MSNKLNWLDSFAESQAKKMNKTASLNKQAEQIIVDPEEIPGAVEGKEVTYNNKKYTVINPKYSDEIGAGVVLEACCEDKDEEKKVNAALEDENSEVEKVEEEVPATDEPVEEAPVEEVPTMEATPAVNDPAMTMEMGTPTPSVPAGSMGAQEYHYTNPGDVYSIGDVRDQVEPQKFQGEAAETEQAWAQENATDRTVPEGKYSTNRIINQIVDSVMPTEPVVPEAPVEEEFKEEELPEMDAPEAPVEEVPTEEVPVEEEKEEVIAPTETVEDETEEVEEKDEEKEEEKKDPLVANKILKRILSLK